jgi:hypothetical protein
LIGSYQVSSFQVIRFSSREGWSSKEGQGSRRV